MDRPKLAFAGLVAALSALSLPVSKCSADAHAPAPPLIVLFPHAPGNSDSMHALASVRTPLRTKGYFEVLTYDVESPAVVRAAAEAHHPEWTRIPISDDEQRLALSKALGADYYAVIIGARRDRKPDVRMVATTDPSRSWAIHERAEQDADALVADATAFIAETQAAVAAQVKAAPAAPVSVLGDTTPQTPASVTPPAVAARPAPVSVNVQQGAPTITVEATSGPVVEPPSPPANAATVPSDPTPPAAVTGAGVAPISGALANVPAPTAPTGSSTAPQQVTAPPVTDGNGSRQGAGDTPVGASTPQAPLGTTPVSDNAQVAPPSHPAAPSVTLAPPPPVLVVPVPPVAGSNGVATSAPTNGTSPQPNSASKSAANNVGSSPSFAFVSPPAGSGQSSGVNNSAASDAYRSAVAGAPTVVAALPPPAADSTFVSTPPTVSAAPNNAAPSTPDHPSVNRDDIAEQLKNVRPLLLRGDAALDRGEVAQAISNYRQAINGAPLSTVPRLKLAQAYLQGGFRDKAIAEAKRALVVAPDNIPVQEFLIHLDADTSTSAGTVALYEALVEKNPTDAGAHIGLGDAYWNNDDLARSETEYKIAEHLLAPGDARASSQLARLYAVQSRYADAGAALKHVDSDSRYPLAVKIIKMRTESLIGTLSSSRELFDAGKSSHEQFYDVTKRVSAESGALSDFISSISPPARFRVSHLHRKLAADLIGQEADVLRSFIESSDANLEEQAAKFEKSAQMEILTAHSAEEKAGLFKQVTSQ